MLQINAPLDDKPQATYRTFYVYSCRKASCLNTNGGIGAVKVFRAQLPSENPYYDLDTADEQTQLQKYKDRQCEYCVPLDIASRIIDVRVWRPLAVLVLQITA